MTAHADHLGRFSLGPNDKERKKNPSEGQPRTPGRLRAYGGLAMLGVEIAAQRVFGVQDDEVVTANERYGMALQVTQSRFEQRKAEYDKAFK